MCQQEEQQNEHKSNKAKFEIQVTEIMLEIVCWSLGSSQL
jgi:hypothetical protein